MSHEPRTISVDETSDIGRLLHAADVSPLRVTAGAASYRVVREDAPADADVRAFNATLDRLIGSWTREDAEAAIAYIYRAREEGSRPPTRP